MICFCPALVQFCPITYHSILLPPIICLKNNNIQFILSPRCNFSTASAARLKRSTFLFWSTSAVDVFFGQLDVKTLTRPLAERAVIHSLMALLKLCFGKGAVVAALLVELSPPTSQICGSNPVVGKISLLITSRIENITIKVKAGRQWLNITLL